jgi:hypothetical protein
VSLLLSRRSLLVPVALVACAVPGVSAQAATPTAKVTLSQVSAKGTKVTVAGRVRLPRDTAAIRRKTQVAVTLANAKGKKESFSAKLDAKRRFTATKTTKLTGALGLSVVVRIAGKRSGATVTRKRAVTVKVGEGATGGPAPVGGAGTTGGTGGSGGAGAGSGSTPGSPASPVQGTPLNGLFRLDPGAQSASGAISGTYFQMLGNGAPLPNNDSTALDKGYTLLRPGTDGGLRTDVYQPAPSPAFSGTIDGRPTGDALANRIVQPQSFFQVKFSTVTDAVDPQTGQADPLPRILVQDGRLTGQTTAWVAQWNGLSFNQGSPKPDGTSPGSTTPVSGTYDAATGHFVLQWKSLIVGGPFDGFTGSWHLEGTFVPAT